MQLKRSRFWILAFLIVLYLAGVLLLSAVTLHESKNKRPSKVLEERVPNYRRLKIQWCSELKLLEPPKEVTALVSYPGSGNTWLRYLLQQSTGVLTGSVYMDNGLLHNGFPAESVTNGSVLVVKTHEYTKKSLGQFKRAVLLVRAPAAAILAEFNRQGGGHIGFAPSSAYKRNNGEKWNSFVNSQLRAWKLLNHRWLYNFTGPTHVIFYEQLVENTENTLRSVLEFLEHPIDEERFQCAMERKEGIYKRKNRLKNYDHFTAQMKTKIKREEEMIYDAIYKIAKPSR